MAVGRGNIDTIQQTQVRELSGGTLSTQFVTTDNSAKTAGRPLVFNADGLAVSAGSASSSVGVTPILDDVTYQPILLERGEWIFPG